MSTNDPKTFKRLGAPAVVAVAKGIADDLRRDRGTIVIEANGRLVAQGISGDDAVRIAEAFAGHH